MDPKSTRVADIMTIGVVTLGASMPVRQAVAALEARGISGAPVADEQGACTGIFSLADAAHGASDEETVGARAATDIVTVPATTSVEAAAKTMVRAGVPRLIVTHDGAIAGILSAMDIVRWTAGFARSGLPEEVPSEIAPAPVER